MGLIKYNMELWSPRGKIHSCCGPKRQVLTPSLLISFGDVMMNAENGSSVQK